jgi:hypothetical protein
MARSARVASSASSSVRRYCSGPPPSERACRASASLSRATVGSLRARAWARIAAKRRSESVMPKPSRRRRSDSSRASRRRTSATPRARAWWLLGRPCDAESKPASHRRSRHRWLAPTGALRPGGRRVRATGRDGVRLRFRRASAARRAPSRAPAIMRDRPRDADRWVCPVSAFENARKDGSLRDRPRVDRLPAKRQRRQGT